MPELFPDHPGQAMNADILKRASQLVLVNMDLFSSYTTACFVESEKADDLAVALIQAVTPIRSNKTLNVRVDKAPGLVKLASSSHTLLDEVGIKLVLADDGNKKVHPRSWPGIALTKVQDAYHACRGVFLPEA